MWNMNNNWKSWGSPSHCLLAKWQDIVGYYSSVWSLVIVGSAKVVEWNPMG